MAELEERIAEIDARWPGFDARLRGYCFFMDQNLPERLTESTELSVNFGYGWLSADREPVEPEEYELQALGIAREVCQCLREEGLEVDWDGSFAKKFGVSVDWRRRELLT